MSACALPQHDPLGHVLDGISGRADRGSGGSAGWNAIGRVLQRVAIASPASITQAQIADGEMLNDPKAMPVATVARAVTALTRYGLLRSSRSGGSTRGRPGNQLGFSPDWTVIGIHLDWVRPHVTAVHAELFSLAGMRSISSIDLSCDALLDDLDTILAEAVESLGALVPRPSGRLLGVGVELGQQTHLDEVVVRGEPNHRLGPDLAKRLAGALTDVAPDGIAVIVENDMTARAIERCQVQGHPSFALVGVLENGVGGALVERNRAVRGARGGVGELGHLTVEFLPTPDDVGFGEPCSCDTVRERRGHINCLATPARISAALGGEDIAVASARPAHDSARVMTREAIAFNRAGTALGRGIAAMLTLNNPGRFHLLLPPALGAARPRTAGALYREAVEAEVDNAYSTAPDDARDDARGTLSVELHRPERAGTEGARAAASCVLGALIDHARGREVCPTADPALG